MLVILGRYNQLERCQGNLRTTRLQFIATGAGVSKDVRVYISTLYVINVDHRIFLVILSKYTAITKGFIYRYMIHLNGGVHRALTG